MQTPPRRIMAGRIRRGARTAGPAAALRRSRLRLLLSKFLDHARVRLLSRLQGGHLGVDDAQLLGQGHVFVGDGEGVLFDARRPRAHATLAGRRRLGRRADIVRGLGRGGTQHGAGGIILGGLRPDLSLYDRDQIAAIAPHPFFVQLRLQQQQLAHGALVGPLALHGGVWFARLARRAPNAPCLLSLWKRGVLKTVDPRRMSGLAVQENWLIAKRRSATFPTRQPCSHSLARRHAGKIKPAASKRLESGWVLRLAGRPLRCVITKIRFYITQFVSCVYF